MDRTWIDGLPEGNRSLIPIVDRVRTEIFHADRAWSIYETVGRFSESLNAKSFGDVFGSIQGACLDQLTLSLTKLFEPPRLRYEILSVPALLSTVSANADRLTILHDTDLRRRFGMPRMGCPTINGAVSRVVVERLQSLLPSREDTDACELSRSLTVHKTRRDKSIAHAEAVDPAMLPATTWEDSRRLLDVAKQAAGVIAFAYTGLALVVDDGTYLLTDDAQRGGMALRRLLRGAGLEPNGTIAA